tara:strand:+ start:356 stop:994 length:639 start_codon:yes stop_codon:yes gene_type:complete
MTFEIFFSSTIWIFLAIGAASLGRGKLRENIRISRTNLSFSIVLISVICFCATSIILNIGISETFSNSIEGEVFKELSLSSLTVTQKVKIFVLIGIVSALGEELFFRGLMLKLLSQWSSIPIAILVSSLAFGISHGNPVQAVAAAILGVYLGVLTIQSKSVRPAVTAHIANNTLFLFWGTSINESKVIWVTLWLALVVLLIKWSCSNSRQCK